MKTMIYLFLVCFQFFNLGCSENPEGLKSSFNINSKNQSNAKPEQISQETVQSENGKSSDDDEGIPGYMSNISVVIANIETDQFVISAPEGSVSQNSKREIYATAWSIPRSSIDKDNKVILAGQSSSAEYVGFTPVASNGSFFIKAVEPELNSRLLITFSYSMSPEYLSFRVDDSNMAAAIWFYKDSNQDKGNSFQQRQHQSPGSNTSSNPKLIVNSLIASDPSLLPKIK